jgi:hypoxanthine phosphoribosyltransferase
MDVEIDFLKASSYGKRLVPSEKVLVDEDLVSTDLKGKDVIIVEDIIDTGNTLRNLLKYIDNFEPSSVRTCALLKREKSAIEFDYVGKIIGEGFIVGYGLDYKGKFRNLPAVYVLGE